MDSTKVSSMCQGFHQNRARLRGRRKGSRLDHHAKCVQQYVRVFTKIEHVYREDAQAVDMIIMQNAFSNMSGVSPK